MDEDFMKRIHRHSWRYLQRTGSQPGRYYNTEENMNMPQLPIIETQNLFHSYTMLDIH